VVEKGLDVKKKEGGRLGYFPLKADGPDSEKMKGQVSPEIDWRATSFGVRKV